MIIITATSTPPPTLAPAGQNKLVLVNETGNPSPARLMALSSRVNNATSTPPPLNNTLS
ncbi:hypothetical protein IPM44_04465 [bacterium]|nr:MAG: hypothetical protein IPM44_04465 [bacterium]